MTLVILYGPPAVGKLTVGTELAKRTGFKLFHNHLTYNPVHALFGDSLPDDVKQLRTQIRHDLLTAAARHEVRGVIYTFMYFQHEDDTKLRAIIDSVSSHGGSVVFVQLTADRQTIEHRTMNESRRATGKLNSLEIFSSVAGSHELFQPVPFEPHFVVDTTHTPPAEAARQIQQHYQLPTHEEEHGRADEI